MVKAKKFIYAKKFEGLPKNSDVQLVEEELPPLKDGEYLCEAVYLSVDPYVRGYMSRYNTGVSMIGGQIAKIIESKNKDMPVGKYVFAQFGWRSHTISSKKSGVVNFFDDVYILPDFGKLPLSLGLGILGMPGNTAYFGFLEICQPKAGETVVVSGAAGAVGSAVGQIAKIKGCNVIGIAGSDDKCQWITKELGFDGAINYKKDDILKKLKEFAPKGVDCYFDNVGGEISSVVISQMKPRGRISVCGSISAHGTAMANYPKASVIQPSMVSNELIMEGFIVNKWVDRWFEGIEQNKKWIEEGKLKYHETITEGFDNMFKAFVDMFQGGNTGKAIIKV